MFKQAWIYVFGGLGLSWLSLLEKEEATVAEDCGVNALCQQTVEREGFPFSFINDYSAEITSGKEFVANQFDIGSAVANLVFWAIVAFLLFKGLSWIFDKFSKLVFIVAIVAVAASYLGVLQIT